jgi:outer membrane protein OmpA-like peptidoglycan-associated protein
MSRFANCFRPGMPARALVLVAVVAGCTHNASVQPQEAFPAQRPDSVSAYETARLRAVAVSYHALRDSLASANASTSEAPSLPPSSVEALATMHAMIHFRSNSSELGDSAKSVLNNMVTVFRANPAMRIVIAGFASHPDTVGYNTALGLQRAEAAQAYLVSQGADSTQIEIATRGTGEFLVEGPEEAADAANGRGQFQLLIADDRYLAAPIK